MNQSMNPDPESVLANHPLLEDEDEEFESIELRSHLYNLPTTPEDIERCLAQLDYLITDIDRIKRGIDAFIEERTALVVRRGKMLIEQREKAINYIMSQLDGYARSERAQGKKLAKFAGGSVGWRKQPDRCEVTKPTLDQKDFEAYPIFIRREIKYTADKNMIKQSAKETGEMPDWATLVEGEEKLTVKLVGGQTLSLPEPKGE